MHLEKLVIENWKRILLDRKICITRKWQIYRDCIATKVSYGLEALSTNVRDIQRLEKFENKLKVGSKIKQGDIIGYVGDSGQATGPHLHFEFWQGDVRTDPVKVKLPSANPVDPSQKDEFKNLLNSNLKKLIYYNSIKYE